MKNTLKFISISIIISLASCGSTKVENTTQDSTTKNQTQNATKTAKDVTIIEFEELIKKGGIILDVRTPNEFGAGHLENAININFYNPNFESEIAKLDRTKTILVYCRSGGRSAKAMKIISKKGFSTVYNMLGGYMAWSTK